jgi:hypothetical protein
MMQGAAADHLRPPLLQLHGSDVPASPASAAGGVLPPDPAPQANQPISAGSSGKAWKRLYIVTACVLAIVIIVAGVAIGLANRKSSGSQVSTTILIPGGTYYSLPVDQYGAVIFSQNTSCVVSGSITNAGGVQFYLMTPSQYLHLVNTYNVSGYEWTSGPIPTGTYYQLDLSIPAGSWDLVFGNSIPGASTAVGFYSNLVKEQS